MLHDEFVYIAEFLFYLTGGTALISSPLIAIAYVTITTLVVWGILMCMFMLKRKWYYAIASVIGFFVVMSITAIPIVQSNILTDCKEIDANVIVESPQLIQDITQDFVVKQCQYKDNYYDKEFGPFELIVKKKE